MALEGVDIKQLAYSPDTYRWTVVINGNQYDFYGVNPYLKRKLNQYIKHNNKRSFFDLLKKFDYKNLSKEKEKKEEPDDANEKNKGSEGQQLSFFEQEDKKIRKKLREDFMKLAITGKVR